MSTAPRPDGVKTYEERDVAMRPIVVGAVALVIIMVATFVLMRIMDVEFRGRAADRSAARSPLAESYGRTEPPAPRLQENPRRDLAALRAREQAQLDGYGWIDRASGRVHVPVAQAMARLLAEGGK